MSDNLKLILNVPHLDDKIIDSYFLNKRYAQYCGKLDDITSFMKKHFVMKADNDGEFDIEGVSEEIQICLESSENGFYVSTVDEKIQVEAFNSFGKSLFKKDYDNLLNYKEVLNDFKTFEEDSFEFSVKILESHRDYISNFISENMNEISIILLRSVVNNLHIDNSCLSIDEFVSEIKQSKNITDKEIKYIDSFLKTKDYKYLLALIKYDLIREFKSNSDYRYRYDHC